MADGFKSANSPGRSEADQRRLDKADRTLANADKADAAIAGVRAGGKKPYETPSGKPVTPTKKPDTPKEPAPAPSAGSKAAGVAGAAAGGAGGIGGLIAKYASQAVTGAKKNRRGFLIGGGVSGLILTLVLGFFGLIPAKIEAMVKAIAGKEFALVEHALERRAEKIFIKYALQRALSPEGGIVATGNPLGDLYRTWRVQQAEGRFLDTHKLDIKPGSTRGSIKITLPDGEKEFSGSSQFSEYLDKELDGKDAKVFLDKMLRDQTRWFQVIKRRHLRRWFSNAYGVRTWRFFKKDTPDAQAADEFEKEMAEATFDEGFKKALERGVECVTHRTQCPGDVDFPDKEVNPPTAEGDEAAKNTTDAITDTAKETPTAGLKKLMETKILSIAAADLVPLIGQIDFIARMDDLLWDKEYLPIMRDIRGTQYASVYVTWLKIADQIKTGEVTAAQVGAALTHLDHIERSRAFHQLFLGVDGGVDIDPDLSLKFDEVQGGFFSLYKIQFGGMHPFLQLYLSTVGAVYGAISDVGGWIVDKLIGGIPWVQSVNEWTSKVFMSYALYMFGPVISPKDGGEVVMNAARIGGRVAANDFMNNELGGIPVKPSAAIDHQTQIAQDNARNNRPSLADRLWSTDDPNSLVMRVVMATPSTPGAALGQGFDYMATMIAHPFNFVSSLGSSLAMVGPSATADDDLDPYGIQYYDIPDAANTDIDQAQIDALDAAARKAASSGRSIDKIVPEDCPDVPEGQVNLCKANVVTIQGLKAMFTTTDNGGFNSLTTPDEQ